jgi:Ca-activated chloride channel family protein
MRVLIAAVLVAMTAMMAASAEDNGDNRGRVMIVLDASGSMWGRLDGKPKIDVARQALGELLAEWRPASVALAAYGHRRKGDCGDIETLVAPGNTEPAAVAKAAADLNPKGKTPLSASVRHAAEALRYTEEPARVILLSDGRETCDADPCAVGAELERYGIDFTAHVIGFDVSGPEQAGLRCLAENTGGHFYPAGKAGELRDALGRAAAQVGQADAGVTLKAVDRPNGPALRADGLRWSVSRVTDGASVLDGEALAVPKLDLAPGQYTARASLGEAVGETQFQVGPGRSEVHELVIDLNASLDAPETANAGGEFAVGWQGPGGEDDYLTLVKKGANQGAYSDWWYVIKGNPLTLRAPGTPGDYEVRYVSGNSGTTLARAAVAVEPVTASLDVPDTVGAGAAFDVAWQGPDHKGDYLTIVDKGAEAGSYGGFRHTREGNPVTLRAPDDPGEYEVRYLSGYANETVASAALTVEAATARVEVPETVTVGARFKAHWQGPANRDDYLTIVKAGAEAGSYGDYSYTREGNPVTLRAPDNPGDYEVRYLSGHGNATVAEAALRVDAADASVAVPAAVKAGETFRVRWQGPDNKGDYVTIVKASAEPGSYGNYTGTKAGNPLTLRAPDESGDYEVRYLSGRGNTTFASTRISIQPVKASLDAPASVTTGEVFQARWQGPDYRKDYVTLVPANAPSGKDGPYAYTRKGTSLTFTAPETSGTYELRYRTGQTGRVLATTTIEVK